MNCYRKRIEKIRERKQRKLRKTKIKPKERKHSENVGKKTERR